MTRYVLGRVAQAVAVLWLLTVIVFGIARLSGNPVDMLVPQGAGPDVRQRLVHEYGFDQPLPVQYWKFISHALRGDFGTSIQHQAPAMRLVIDRLGATAELASAALAIAIVLGIALGTLAALRRGRLFDHVVGFLITLGQATPTFWLGIILILYFGVELHWFPIAGRSGALSLVMPAVTLSIVPLVGIARLTRSSVIGVLPQDHVRTARAKGLRESRVVIRHVLRNGLVPVVTFIGVTMSGVLSGAVITEQIFAWPGVGNLAIGSIQYRDYAVIQAVTLLASVIVLAINLAVDLSYGLLDPRIRLRAKQS